MWRLGKAEVYEVYAHQAYTHLKCMRSAIQAVCAERKARVRVADSLAEHLNSTADTCCGIIRPRVECSREGCLPSTVDLLNLVLLTCGGCCFRH